MKYHAYIASGWFNEAQEESRQMVLNACKRSSLKIYSPKEEIVCNPAAGLEERKAVFDSNVDAIRNSLFVICNTQDKDMGTIFEAGVAHTLSKPIIYFAHGLAGNFNLMLAESGNAVATNEDELVEHITMMMREHCLYRKEYVGHIE